MRMSKDARFLLLLGMVLCGMMYLFAGGVLCWGQAADVSGAMYLLRVSAGAREVAPGLLLVGLIGAMAFDLGERSLSR